MVTPEDLSDWVAAWAPGPSTDEHGVALGQIVEKVVFDPASGNGRIHDVLPLDAGGKFNAPEAAALLGLPGLNWRPHGDSNPGTHRERVMS